MSLFTNPTATALNRRSLLSAAGIATAGVSVAQILDRPIEDQLSHLTQNVRRASSPSELKITDMRIAVVAGVPFTSPIVRIDTNQGISGYGEVRDDADKRYALMLKSRILGENPCNVEKIFKIIKQFGGHGRQGGGVSGVEMALWDLTGKAFEVPVYQLLGGKYRDKIRLYTDTAGAETPEAYAEQMKKKIDEFGYTFVKMDVGIELIRKIPGTLTGAKPWGDLGQYDLDPPSDSYGSTEHPYTGIEITDKGMDEIAKFPAAMREAIGWDIPLGIDHIGHFGVNSAIRLARRLEEYSLAYLEDIQPWFHHKEFKQITDSSSTPIMTGEDVYGLDGFRPLLEGRTCDYVHPDIATAGGILETKRIGDLAQEHNIPMFIHYAGSPIGAMAAAHVAAATENFMALEQHSSEVDFWEDLVTGLPKPLVDKGYYHVSDAPGLGLELVEDVVREHLAEGEKYFAATKEWDDWQITHDRQWS
ncbi:mandelate racemase/muconate lactonizing enzyme family protein [Nocardioides albus]|uniref:L-alanine-DL-glutamate epimerase-like enolase superfamily enzyme n=1 Tax=Nocardioides albus TaxID=1841 RepID=A0A7W5F8T4_9ACTN|nr:mandelate racemase/muconate lactonizing enzyme family protein [Nocardioides albus]MBB3089292.1 L-alanine-DL-glutamate epimerase-like enolase superfamily enzyme [Nocardioides albus]GGU12966.1 mandelate racemase [Nocardioides albus]